MGERLRRWTFDADGKPRDLVDGDRPILLKGRPVEWSNVSFKEEESLAQLTIQNNGGSAITYVLLPEKNRLRVTLEGISRGLEERLFGWVDGYFQIERD